MTRKITLTDEQIELLVIILDLIDISDFIEENSPEEYIEETEKDRVEIMKKLIHSF